MKALLLTRIAIFGFSLLSASNAFGKLAKSGQGNFTVAPNTVRASSLTNFVFTFRSPAEYLPGSQATVVVPAGWPAPQTNNSTSASFLSVTPLLTQSTSVIASVTGSGPWTVTINFSTKQKNGGFTLSYSNVTVPTNMGVHTFATRTKQNGGTLTNLKSGSPAVNVTTPSKFNTSTEVISSLTPSVYGQWVTFTATVTPGGAGTMSGTITFKDGDVTLGTSSVNGAGQATLSTNRLPASDPDSPLSIYAEYSGNSNYNGSISPEVLQEVTAAPLTVSNLVVNDRVYDGTTAASLNASAATLVGLLFGNDEVTLDLTNVVASFSNPNVANGKIVSIEGLAITGADAENYLLTVPSLSGNVTPRPLVISATAANKIYNGSTAATVTLSDNRVAGDSLTISHTSAAFTNKTAGTGKTVTASGISVTGADVANYTFSPTATTSADITPRPLSISILAQNKVYDGSAVATVTLSDNRIAGDSLTIGYSSAAFANKTVGTGKTVTMSGISVTGADAANYSSNTTATASANITARPLTVSVTAQDKVYDGSAVATVTLSDNRIPGDALTIGYSSAVFANKTPGTGKTVTVSGISVTGTDAANYTSNTTATASANITARPLTVSVAAQDKVYDGSTVATVTLSDDRIAGDSLTINYSSAAFADKTVGTGKTVNVSGISVTGTGAANYTSSPTATTTANITTRSITVSVTAQDKVYDGSAVATVTLSDDRIAGDSLTIGYSSAAFADKTVGTGKTVTVSAISVTGTGAANYTSNPTATTTANITARPFTVSVTAQDKVYDGSAVAAVTLSDDRMAGDSLTIGYSSAAFTDKTVGTDKTVSVSGISVTGVDAANYTSSPTATTTADIATRPLTVSVTAQDKVYDGSAVATVTLSDDRIAADSLTIGYSSAAFADKTAGTGKTVTVSGISVTGTDAANYSSNPTATTTAAITTRSLTVSVTAQDKVYDGSAVATVTLSDNRIAGDSLTIGFSSAAFADKTAGTGKTVTVSGISVTGTDTANYTSNPTATASANITTRSITVSVTAQDKVYDGSAVATVTLSDDRIAGDSLTIGYSSAAFADKTAGTAKTVTVSGISVTGVDAANYTSNPTATTTADITARPLTVSVTAQDKVYDGSTVATVTLSDDRIAADSLTIGYSSAAFADKTAGTGKTVTVSGISVTGVDAANYTSNPTATTTADITARPLTVSVTAQDKVYDGSTVATVTLSDDRIAADSLTIGYSSAAFADKTVGTGKPVTVSGISVTGVDAVNYTSNPTATTTADITARPLTITVTAQDKVYDGSTVATATLSDDRIAGDSLTVGYSSAAFGDKSVGTGKTVTVSGISVTGVDAVNYTSNPTATTTADITTRAITVSVTAQDKVYDGSTVATVTLSDDRVAGDSLTISYSSAAFGDKTVGTGKTVTVSGISITGVDAANYLSNPTATTSADITARPLTITATAQDKVYDGSTVATVTLSDDRIAGDSLTISYSSASFADKIAGTGKTVTVSGISVTSADAPNYVFSPATTTSADITPLPVTVSITAYDKVYDGTAAAEIATSVLNGVIAGDAVNPTGGTATFADANVGTGKTVTATGLGLTGTDAENYALQSTTAITSASITAATLTVTANNTNRIYGAANPSFTATYSGLVTGDGGAVITGFPAFSTTADVTSPVGGNPYVIVVTNGTLAADNYVFAFVNGQLTIDPADSSTVISFSANPSPTGSNVTLSATVTAATGSGTPAGMLQFLANGLVVSSPVSVSGGIAALGTSSLPHGTNVISAIYIGDGNFSASSNSSSLLINTAPVAQSANLNVMKNTAGTLSVSNLLTGCSDPDGDPLSFNSVSTVSSQGGTVSLNNGTITYTPAADYVGADSFTYSISDSFGAISADPVTVNVTVQAPAVSAPATLSITRLGGNMRIDAIGTSSVTYRIQTSTNLLAWTTVSTNTADANGAFTFTDTTANQSLRRFYRTVSP